MGRGKAKIVKGLSSTDSDGWPGLERVSEEAAKARAVREAGKKEYEDSEFAYRTNRDFGINESNRPVLSYGKYKGLYILKLPTNFSQQYYSPSPKYDNKQNPNTLVVYVIRDESGVQPDGSIVASKRGVPTYTVVYADGSRQSSPHFRGPGPSMNDRIWEYLFNMALPEDFATRTYDGGTLQDVVVVRPPIRPVNGGLDKVPWTK